MTLTTTTTTTQSQRSSREIMAEMRSTLRMSGTRGYPVSVDLEREYMAAQDRERVAEREQVKRGGWFGRLLAS